jgi:hypothetical protein
MAANTQDFSALDKFNFERKPVGVKFMITRPEGIKRIDKELNMCEMLKEAQENDAFYVAPEDWVCVGVEQMILGMEDPEPVLVSGIFGGEEGLFKGDNACRAMYDYLPRMQKGSVRYVAFAPLDKLTFDPDVLILTATIAQAQTLVRSINYSTGRPLVISGELNYFITGLGLGMQALNIFPPGLFIISVPYQLIPTMLENVKNMEYSTELAPGPGGAAHRKRVNKFKADLKKKIEQ